MNLTYDPIKRFSDETHGKKVPLLFISPSQYVQSPDAILRLGEFLFDLSGPKTQVGILITKGRRDVLMDKICKSLNANGLKSVDATFNGESTFEEVERVASVFGDAKVTVVVGVGGGKCLDTARMAANRLDANVVTIPTTASTDAPTAAVSVLYNQNGVFESVEYSRKNPLLVLADETILADAPERYLSAGMGDAFSTYFEARCCMENPNARTGRGARPTGGALAIAHQCREQLLAHGTNALEEIKEKKPGEAFRQIVEANILLSGLGFESGGLAAAHSVAQGLTECEDLHKNFLHGELVAVGVIVQLLLEERLDELRTAKKFLRSVNLPTHLGELGFDPEKRSDEFNRIIDGVMRVPFIYSEPIQVTKEMLRKAFLRAIDL